MKSGDPTQGTDYNTAGALYKKLRNDLYGTDNLTFETIESFTLQNMIFTHLYLTSYQLMTQNELEAVMAKAIADLNAFASSVNLSASGRQEFLDLITGLQKIKQENGSRTDVAAYLGQCEGKLANQPDLNAYDKNLLLTTAVVLKHSYAADCGEGGDEDEDCDHGDDKDWELSIGHVAAAAYGSSFGPGNAITCSLYGYYNP